MKTTILALSLLTLTHAPARAAVGPTLVGALDLPGDARPLSTHYDVSTKLLLIGNFSNPTRAELYAIAFDNTERTPHVAWSVDLDSNVDSIDSDGTYAYLATPANGAELVIVNLAAGTVAGTYDAAGGADGLAVAVESAGVVTLDRRKSDCPEHYRLDVSNPSNVTVLSTEQRDVEVTWPPVEANSSAYSYPGFLVSETTVITARGTVRYGVSRGAPQDLYVLERTRPVAFVDATGDGIYKLGCVGDSNTANPTVSWCPKLHSLVNDPKQFATANVAVAGATVVSPNLRWYSDATMQMSQVLTMGVDAVVLAFGTNDFFQGRTPMEVVAAYIDQAETAAAAGVAFYVALTPPIVGCQPTGCAPIQAINDAIIAAFDADQIIDFWSDFNAADYNADGYHFNTTGQSKRAGRVYDVIRNHTL